MLFKIYCLDILTIMSKLDILPVGIYENRIEYVASVDLGLLSL